MLKRGLRLVFLGVMVLGVSAARERPGEAQQSTPSARMPVFEVDTSWPKVPNDWVLGTISSVAVDAKGHMWVLHRPLTVPEKTRDKAAPPVLEFDANGAFVKAWSGEGSGFEWPDQPHGISVDHKGNVWITGAGYNANAPVRSDDMLLKFSNAGKFLMMIGGRSVNRGNADTKNLNRPADVFVDAKTNEAYVADGYGNRRVIVLDADTGAFKRMWGAMGNKPEDGPQGLFAPPAAAAPPPPEGKRPGNAEIQIPTVDTGGPGLPQFSVPVHAVKVSNDGLVYVADRVGRRVQVFTTSGKYVNQVFINRAGPSRESAAGVAFSPDSQQEFLYVADFGNSRVVVLNRKSLEVLYQFGTRTATPGNFQGLHHLAADLKGNLYTAEVAPGNRAQRFIFKGTSTSPPPNALTTEKAASR
jgi:DNA-binding beta-propeller fold protein YncE